MISVVYAQFSLVKLKATTFFFLNLTLDNMPANPSPACVLEYNKHLNSAVQ